MPLYKFSEKDANGVVTRNVMEAMNREQLIKDRYKHGQFVFKMEEAVSYIKRRKLKDKELADFANQVSVLLGSGVPIVRALDIMANEGGSRAKMKTLCSNMVSSLQRGYSLAEAMRLQGGAFPELIVAVFHSGEISGSLDLAAKKMAEYYDKMFKIQQKVNSATSYPKLVGGMTVAIVLFLFSVILPQFLGSIDIPPEELPVLTRVMMNISNLIRTQYILLIAVAAGVAYAYLTLSKLPAFKSISGRLLMQIPVVSKQLKLIYTARFSTTLSNLYLSGVPLSLALGIAAKTIGNSYVEREIETSLVAIEHGRSLSSALRSVTGLNTRMYQVVFVGEETGKLGEVLENMGSAFDAEVDTAVSQMISILNPILLVIMTGVVGSVMAAILMPLMQSYQHMV